MRDTAGSVVVKALALLAIAGGVGAVDSIMRPVVVRLPDAPPAGVTAPGPAAPVPGAAGTEARTPATSGNEGSATPITAPGAEPTAAPSAGDAPLDPATFGRMLTVPQAKALYEQGAFFVDGRVRAEFDAGRIPGALHATPAMLLDGTAPDVLALPRELAVVIYCGGGDCTDSENIAIVLTQAGFTRLHILKDGYPGWKDAGLAVEEPAAGGPGDASGGGEAGGSGGAGESGGAH